MQEDFVFSGFGGQGVMFAGQLLAYAAMDEGLEVTWIPSYGPEMRGGTAHCFVVISDKPIGSPMVQYPGVAVVLNNPSFDKYEPMVAKNGLLALNSSLVKRESKRHDILTLGIPASDVADQIGNMKLMNMVMLGSVLAMRPVVSIEALKRALEGHIPSHRRDMIAMNFEAIERGAALTEQPITASFF